MKKFLAALAVVGGSFATFAAEGDSMIDTAALNTAIGSLVDSLTSWVSAVIPIILPIAGSFMLFWIVKLVIRIIKSFGSSAK